MSDRYRLEERLGDLLQTGGMIDPAFLYGQVRALLDMLAQVRAERDEAVKVLKEGHIAQLEIGVRAYNCLMHADAPSPHPHYHGGGYEKNVDDPWTPPTGRIQTVEDLVQWSRHDLLKLKNFGAKSLREVEVSLQRLGLGLKEATDGRTDTATRRSADD